MSCRNGDSLDGTYLTQDPRIVDVRPEDPGDADAIRRIHDSAFGGHVEGRIGSALMRAAIAVAERHDLPLVALLGHGAYYRRFGFEPAQAIGVEPPRPWPDESWLALRLPGWTPELRGRVRYPPAFPVD